MKKHRNLRNSFTLVEILISLSIAAFLTAAVLSIYPALFQGIDTSAAITTAVEAAKGKIEALKFKGVASIISDSSIKKYNPSSQSPIANKFTDCGNCDCSLQVNKDNYDTCRYFGTDKGNYSGVFYVEDWQPSHDILLLEVVVCYKAGKRVIGEDQNLNGQLDAGEDVNNDGKITSPVTLKTIITSAQ